MLQLSLAETKSIREENEGLARENKFYVQSTTIFLTLRKIHEKEKEYYEQLGMKTEYDSTVREALTMCQS